MKRSCSLFDISSLNHPRPGFKLNDTRTHSKNKISSQSPAAKKGLETAKSENLQIFSPVPLKKSFQGVISKIYTSDFWTPTMKFQYKKLSEGKATKNCVALTRSPVLCKPLLEERLKKPSEESVKTDIRNSTKLENLNKIINECVEERSKNKRLGKDIHCKRKTMIEDFRRAKNSINYW